MFFSKPRYPRYAIDLSHPTIRYAIAAAIPLLFQITAHVWLAAVTEDWSKVPLEMFRKALSSWSKHVMAIHKAHGHDVSE